MDSAKHDTSGRIDGVNSASNPTPDCALGHDCAECGPRFEWAAHPLVQQAMFKGGLFTMVGSGATAIPSYKEHAYSRAMLLAVANRGSRNKIVRVPVKLTQHTPVCSTVCEADPAATVPPGLRPTPSAPTGCRSRATRRSPRRATARLSWRFQVAGRA